MPEGFVHLSAFLRPQPPRRAEPAQTQPPPEPAIGIGKTQTDADRELAQALAGIRRFRAALADALDVALERLLTEIACDVLARELRLAPADIANVVTRARERIAAEEPLEIRVHPEDAAALAGSECRILADDRLRRGDVRFEVRSGSIDVGLGARLEQAIEACVR